MRPLLKTRLRLGLAASQHHRSEVLNWRRPLSAVGRGWQWACQTSRASPKPVADFTYLYRMVVTVHITQKIAKRALLALVIGCIGTCAVIMNKIMFSRNVLQSDVEPDALEGDSRYADLFHDLSQAALSRKIKAVSRYIAEVEKYKNRIENNRRYPHEEIQVPSAPSSNHDGVNWGSLDCRLHGPSWESRALGCPRPGGCGLRPPKGRTNHLAACGIQSGVCVGAFKACLHSGWASGRSSYSEACDCYRDLSPDDACGEACASSLLDDYAGMATKCFGFDPRSGALTEGPLNPRPADLTSSFPSTMQAVTPITSLPPPTPPLPIRAPRRRNAPATPQPRTEPPSPPTTRVATTPPIENRIRTRDRARPCCGLMLPRRRRRRRRRQVARPADLPAPGGEKHCPLAVSQAGRAGRPPS